jgi:hypothetical protein
MLIVLALIGIAAGGRQLVLAKKALLPESFLL